MKIGIISDLHIDYGRARDLANLKDAAIKSLLKEIDCLVMCGDNAEPTPKLDNHKRLFKTLRDNSDIPVAFITGNHDLIGPILREGVTMAELRIRLFQYSITAKNYNVVHLEDENLVLDDMTICGTYGHYDGSLSGMMFQEDYCSVSRLVLDLKRRAQIPGRKILVTHSVPNLQMIGKSEGPVQDEYTPFAGSLQLEVAIRTIKPTWHFCGHTHAYAKSKIGETTSFNVGTDYSDFFYFILDTSNSSVKRLEKKLK